MIHRGRASYLPFILHQLRNSNPRTDIALIGDQTWESSFPVKYYDLNDYLSGAEEFNRLYKNCHRSCNSFFFESICFQRTFIMEEFCRRHHLQKIWHLDSDVLCFSSLAGFVGEDAQYALILPSESIRDTEKAVSPHTAFWSLPRLEHYNRFLIECMTPGTDCFDVLTAFWEEYRKNHTAGGVCDMTTLWLYVKKFPEGLLDLSRISGDGRFSYSFSVDMGSLQKGESIRKKDGAWRLFDERGNAVKKFYTLHMQGLAKYRIPFFYLGPAFPKRKWYRFCLFLFFLKTLGMNFVRRHFRIRKSF